MPPARDKPRAAQKTRQASSDQHGSLGKELSEPHRARAALAIGQPGSSQLATPRRRGEPVKLKVDRGARGWPQPGRGSSYAPTAVAADRARLADQPQDRHTSRPSTRRPCPTPRSLPQRGRSRTDVRARAQPRHVPLVSVQPECGRLRTRIPPRSKHRSVARKTRRVDEI